MDIKTDWIVLLIGGCSGTGKSTLAKAVANKHKAELARVDDYRMALQSATEPEHYPELHFFISSPGISKQGIWGKTPEVLCDALINVGKFVSQALEVVLNHHINTGKRIVLEGDGIVPEMVSRIKETEARYDGRLRSVFLFEPDKEFFFEKDMLVEKGKSKLYKEIITIRTIHWLYGQWLVEEAKTWNLPLVQSRPWETLYNRVISAIK